MQHESDTAEYARGSGFFAKLAIHTARCKAVKTARRQRPLSKQLFVFLQGLHDESIELLGDLKFDKRLERDGLLVGIYASMIELTGGVLLLVQGNRYGAVSAVFRTFLEA